MKAESPTDGRSRAMSRLLWLALGAGGVLALSIVAGLAPVGLRKLALYHAAFGVCCGLLLGTLSREIRAEWGAGLLPLSGLLAVLGGLNLAWVSYRPFVAERDEQRQRSARDLAAMSMMQEIAADDPEVQRLYAEERREYESSFRAYLANRVSRLGRWREPWPMAFWLGELVLSASLAMATARQLARSGGEPRR